MTTPETIRSLISDLQAAEVGSRDLDMKLAVVSGRYRIDGHRKSTLICRQSGYSLSGGWPQATQSIDAAMTAIPDGWEWVEGHVVRQGGDYVGATHAIRQLSQGTLAEGWHKRHPIAICIASLSARLKELETT